MKYFAEEIVKAAQEHARKVFPEESVGLVVDGAYVPIQNVAADPSTHIENDRHCNCRLCSFEVGIEDATRYRERLAGVIHSHPMGPFFPSRGDMEAQIATDVPWAIVVTDGNRVSDLVEWGGDVPIAPILGRTFMHGIRDCYSLIRDTYKLGKEELAKQSIDWPFDPIDLPEFPRDDCWWELGENMYVENFRKAGFYEIRMSEAQPGDVFVMKLLADRANHAGLLLSNNLIMHHLPGETRISRREPAGGWARSAEMWLRFDPELLEKNNA